MKYLIAIATLAISSPAFAQAHPPVRSVQQVMQAIGGDWQSMETAKNHVIVGLGELQTMAVDLENKNRALTAENAETKKKLEAANADNAKLKAENEKLKAETSKK